MSDIVSVFVQEATGGLTGRAARVALFYAVRNLPYATDAASDAVTLVRVGRGNCLAKADLLAQGFGQMGLQTRMTRWRYSLPDMPPEIALLPTRDDIHTAIEVFLGGSWRLIDATHDPPLARIGLVSASWDGMHDTDTAYFPRGERWRVRVDDDAIAAAITTITARYSDEIAACVVAYRVAFNHWLDEARTEVHS